MRLGIVVCVRQRIHLVRKHAQLALHECLEQARQVEQSLAEFDHGLGRAAAKRRDVHLGLLLRWRRIDLAMCAVCLEVHTERTQQLRKHQRVRRARQGGRRHERGGMGAKALERRGIVCGVRKQRRLQRMQGCIEAWTDLHHLDARVHHVPVRNRVHVVGKQVGRVAERLRADVLRMACTHLLPGAA